MPSTRWRAARTAATSRWDSRGATPIMRCIPRCSGTCACWPGGNPAKALGPFGHWPPGSRPPTSRRTPGGWAGRPLSRRTRWEPWPPPPRGCARRRHWISCAPRWRTAPGVIRARSHRLTSRSRRRSAGRCASRPACRRRRPGRPPGWPFRWHAGDWWSGAVCPSPRRYARVPSWARMRAPPVASPRSPTRSRRGPAGCSTASPTPQTCGVPKRAGGLAWRPMVFPCSAGRGFRAPAPLGRWRCWPPTRGGAARRCGWRRAAADRWTSTMSSPDRVRTLTRRWMPARMQRIALVAPVDRLRDTLVAVAASGTVELDQPTGSDGAPPAEAGRALQRLGVHPGSAHMDAQVTLSATAPDVAALERAGAAGLLAGEAQLQRYAAGAVHRGDLAAMGGWCPSEQLPTLRTGLGAAGAAAVPMPTPRGVDPPTLLGAAPGLRGGFAALVRTYGTVPYHDIDPTMWAGLAYVVMFGMMFGDVGHGLLIVAAAVMLRMGWIRRFASLKPMWVFIAAAGVAATIFGVLYGECFGPTGIVPVVWLSPLADPLRLLLVALAVGAVLLGVAYTVGAVNRWREGGVRLALYAPSGIAGAIVFVGAGAVVAGYTTGPRVLVAVGAAVSAAGLLLALAGLYAESGGGASGVLQAAVGGLDLVVRLGSNLVSFARLAAFGMTHAALGWVVWRGTTALWGHGWAGAVGAVLVFVVGNAVAFALEALVAGVQALRLEFYELFSRVFIGEGRPFRPWMIPVVATEAATC